ncbi:MAG: DUF2254 family protein [Micropruina glycogenica]
MSRCTSALPRFGRARGRALGVRRGRVTDDQLDAVRRAFEINAHRTYDQDPRLGLVALAEIAIRALSPAVNDPGTAIEVLGALERVTLVLLGSDPSGEAQRARYTCRPRRWRTFSMTASARSPATALGRSKWVCGSGAR